MHKRTKTREFARSAYRGEIERLFRFLVPRGARVAVLGCEDGSVLASLDPSYGLGVDRSTEMIEKAKSAYGDRGELRFVLADVESVDLSAEEPFDYIVMPDLLPSLGDVQSTLAKLHPVCSPATRLVMNYKSNLWRPMLSLATALGLRKKVSDYNWLSSQDVRNLLHLAGFEPVTSDGRVLLPVHVPLLSALLNRLMAKMPLVRQLCLTWCMVARPAPDCAGRKPNPSVSILVPTRNEKGNIEEVFERVNSMGEWTELVFVDGHSDDGTVEEIERCIAEYSPKWPRVKLLHQTGKGKGQGVRQAFESCEGDILMILDSDLTMPPEELPKYYAAITAGKGEFINGCRLVYPQEQQAMGFLNMIANHTFALLFSWMLGQPVKDTLCGTKVLSRSDYRKIAANRSYFGDFDPFADFDLLFGAAKLNLKIIDLPIRYRARTYGEIKINRWRDGFLLLRMALIAFRRFKLS